MTLNYLYYIISILKLQDFSVQANTVLRDFVTLFLFFTDLVAVGSGEPEAICKRMTDALEVRIELRTLIPQCSTVLIYDAYGDFDIDQLVLHLPHLPFNLVAVAVDDGEGIPSLLDNSMYVHIIPTWSCLVGDVIPPEELVIRDCHKNDIISECCCALTRKGGNCQNRTRHESHFCWRHRPTE